MTAARSNENLKTNSRRVNLDIFNSWLPCRATVWFGFVVGKYLPNAEKKYRYTRGQSDVPRCSMRSTWNVRERHARAKQAGMQRSVNRIEKLKFRLWNSPSYDWRNGFPTRLNTNKHNHRWDMTSFVVYRRRPRKIEPFTVCARLSYQTFTSN